LTDQNSLNELILNNDLILNQRRLTEQRDAEIREEIAQLIREGAPRIGPPYMTRFPVDRISFIVSYRNTITNEVVLTSWDGVTFPLWTAEKPNLGKPGSQLTEVWLPDLGSKPPYGIYTFSAFLKKR
jgi:hypothetical protein